ncbi:MAG: ParB/RepB/Spo0J family partition protein [Alphaproteobacteria bacterium]
MSMASSRKKTGLGRGLSALFDESRAVYQEGDQGAQNNSTPREISIEMLEPGKYQPRRHFDREALEELSSSIRERGLVQPILVRPIGQPEAGRFEIIAGERRWRASQLAGLHRVPVIIREMEDREALELGLIENLQRRDLSPIEEARGYARLMEEFKHTQEAMSRVVGKSRPHIANLLRLLNLPKEVQDHINEGRLSQGHGKVLAGNDNARDIAAEILRRNLSVRETERIASRWGQDGAGAEDETDAKPKKRRKTTTIREKDSDLLAVEADMTSMLGMECELEMSSDAAGRLCVSFKDFDQLDFLLARLMEQDRG